MEYDPSYNESETATLKRQYVNLNPTDFQLPHYYAHQTNRPTSTSNVLSQSVQREINPNELGELNIPSTPYTPSLYSGPTWEAMLQQQQQNQQSMATPQLHGFGTNFQSNNLMMSSEFGTPPESPMTYDVNKTAQSSFFPSNSTTASYSSTNQQQQPSQKILTSIHQHQLDQKDRIEKMYQNQRQFMAAPQEAGYNLISNEQNQLKSQIESELQTLQSLYDTVILDPPDLQKLLWLKQDLEVQMKQLELLIWEMRQLTQQPTGNNKQPW
jgi:hypothetical protein